MRLGGKYRDQLAQRFDAAVRWRVDEQQAGPVGHIEGRLTDLQARLQSVADESFWTANELRRLAPHLAALEARVAKLEERETSIRVADSAEVDQARSLIDEIKAEHERIRVRLSAVARYEERLERLEGSTQSL